jgi:hypothetical protein
MPQFQTLRPEFVLAYQRTKSASAEDKVVDAIICEFQTVSESMEDKEPGSSEIFYRMTVDWLEAKMRATMLRIHLDGERYVSASFAENSKWKVLYDFRNEILGGTDGN